MLAVPYRMSDTGHRKDMVAADLSTPTGYLEYSAYLLLQTFYYRGADIIWAVRVIR